MNWWLVFILLTLLVALLLAAPLFITSLRTWLANQSGKNNQSIDSATQQSSVNLAVHRRRLEELDDDLRSGVISSAAYQEAKQELATATSQDVAVPAEDEDKKPATEHVNAPLITSDSQPLWFGISVFTFLLFLTAALGIYFWQGAWFIEQQREQAQQQNNPVILLNAIEQSNQEYSFGDYVRLARAYIQAGTAESFAGAERAFAKAVPLMPDTMLTNEQSNFYFEYGYVVKELDQGQFGGRAKPLFYKAVALDPSNEMARLHAGIAADQNQDHQAVVNHFGWLIPRTPDEDIRARLLERVSVSRAALGLAKQSLPESSSAAGSRSPESGPSDSQQAELTPPAEPQLALIVNIDVAADLAAEVPEGAILFVFAKAANSNSRMPLAVQRFERYSFPLQVRLTDQDALMPAGKLSDFSEWLVTARLSASGIANPSPGDLFGDITVDIQQVETTDGALSLLINQTTPNN